MIRFDRFDTTEMPKRPKWYLMPEIWAKSTIELLRHRTKIRKWGMKGLKPPYLVLGNHNSMLDFHVAAVSLFPLSANAIVSIDAFIGREDYVRNIGGICKRKYTSDPVLVRQLKHAADHKGVVLIYPEAKLSVCGTTSVLPDSIGQLAKKLEIPVVTLICYGHHINDPCWGNSRGVYPTEAEMSLLYTPDDLKKLTVDDINNGIKTAFAYDDLSWQKEKKLRVNAEQRAVGLHKVLYQCPSCGREYRMASKGNLLECSACGKKWHMDEYGELIGAGHSEGFAHIPDWFEWERENVRREVEEGVYTSGKLNVIIDSLPGSDGFIRLGKGILKHDSDGFHVRVTEPSEALSQRPTETRIMERNALSTNTCHVVYDKRGDCIDLNTNEDTWYIYPKNAECSVTKIMLACEELYKHLRKKEYSASRGFTKGLTGNE